MTREVKDGDLKPGKYLEKAYLFRWDLQGKDLSGACLKRADLEEADLRGAKLENADLRQMMITRGLAQAARFTWEQAARRLLSTFRSARSPDRSARSPDRSRRRLDKYRRSTSR